MAICQLSSDWLLMGKLVFDLPLVFVKLLACCVVPKKLIVIHIALSGNLMLLLPFQTYSILKGDFWLSNHFQQVPLSPQRCYALQVVAFPFQL
jgi:hypothetical protein